MAKNTKDIIECELIDMIRQLLISGQSPEMIAKQVEDLTGNSSVSNLVKTLADSLNDKKTNGK